MKTISIFGSTGSIGLNALDIISKNKNNFKVKTLSTNTNIEILNKQIKQFKPKSICIADLKKAALFKKRYSYKGIKLYEGESGLAEMAGKESSDILLMAIVGSAALLPTLESIKNIKRLALANKEAIVMAGEIIKKKAKRYNVDILPVDSEHSAFFQCLLCSDPKEARRFYLTGSGGPFFKRKNNRSLENITPEEAIKHPKWNMGKKISVDSATLMNKGLEVIEASQLFDISSDKIEVVIHPEAVIHSMVEFIDGSIIAQLGSCDMRIPIQYAFSYPKRIESSIERIDLTSLSNLHFAKPDMKRFPCLGLAYLAAKKGGSFPCVLNASNEVCVENFLQGKIKFTDIPKIIEKVLKKHKNEKDCKVKEIITIDKWAKHLAKEMISDISY